MADDWKPRRDHEKVILTGAIYPAAPRSVFLASPELVLEGDQTIPLPDECVQVLASREHFSALQKLPKQPVRLSGILYDVPANPETILMSIRVRDRSTHPYCQYGKSHMPVLYLTSWARP